MHLLCVVVILINQLTLACRCASVHTRSRSLSITLSITDLEMVRHCVAVSSANTP